MISRQQRAPRRTAALLGAAALLHALGAVAAGYDQPLPSAARQIGMGGAGLADAQGALAPGSNPAGLAATPGWEVEGGLTLMTGVVRASPEPRTNLESERVVAPLPHLGVAARLHPRLGLGLLLQPIAAAGAVYEYEGAVGATRDETRAAFFEAAVGLGVQLPYGLALGLAHRSTYAQMQRYKRGAHADAPGIQLDQRGMDFSGLRLGLTWRLLSEAPRVSLTARQQLRLGVVYRHGTDVELSAEDGIVLAQPVRDVSTTLHLPARVGAGLRTDLGRWGGAFEAELVRNGDNARGRVSATLGGAPLRLPALYDWTDSVLLRAGVELRLLEAGELSVRAGLVRDAAAASRRYPTPFGPPPAPTYAGTLGAGFTHRGWAGNLAYAYRFGGTTLGERELGAELCAFCGYAGRYEARLHVIAVDVGRHFE